MINLPGTGLKKTDYHSSHRYQTPKVPQLEVIGRLPFRLHAEILPPWVCRGLTHAVTIPVISSVHLPYSVQKTLFPRCHAVPLTLTVFQSSFPRLLSVGGRHRIIYVPLRAEHSTFCTLTSWEWVVVFGVVDHFIFSLSKYFGVKPQDTTGTVNVKCPLPRSQESFLSLPHRIGSWCLSSWLFSLLLKLTFIRIFFICSLYAFLQELCPVSAKVFYEPSNLKIISSEFPWDPDAQWAHSVMSSVFALALSTQVPMSWTFKHSTLCSGILLLAVSHLLLDHPEVVLQHCWSVIPWLPSLCFRWSFHFFFLKKT